MSSAPIPIVSSGADEFLVRADGMALAEGRVTVIEPHAGWRLVNLREIWAYRELLYFLT